MARLRRPEIHAEAARRNQEHLARLGGELRASRRRRRFTQEQLGAGVGVVQSTISQMERGHGGSLSVDVWQRAFLVIDRRLLLAASRDPAEEAADAGHLAIQELVLRLGRAAGFRGTFELPVRPAASRHSVDVCLRDGRRRLLLLVECWNTINDIGAAARSFSWKLAKAEEAAVALGGHAPALGGHAPALGGDAQHRVRGCWVIRATARSRQLVVRYPESFASRFPGPSVGWVSALTAGTEPPTAPGIVWCDVAASRLFAWRRR